MKINSKKSKGGVSLSFTGELTIYHILEAYKQLSSLSELEKSNLDIDLSNVIECDSAGIQLLLFLKKKCKEGRLRINKINPCVTELIDTLRLGAYFNLAEG